MMAPFAFSASMGSVSCSRSSFNALTRLRPVLAGSHFFRRLLRFGPLQFCLKVLPNRRPFLIDDAELNGISLPSIGHYQILTNNPFLFRAQAKNGGAGRLVDFVRGKLPANAVQPLEGEAEHEQFGFGVDESSVPRLCQPRPANLEVAVLPVDLPKARGTDNETRRFAYLNDKRNGGAIGPAVQRDPNVSVHGFRGGNNGIGQLPEFAIAGGLDKIGTIRRQHRPQSYSWTDQRVHVHVESFHVFSACGSPVRPAREQWRAMYFALLVFSIQTKVSATRIAGWLFAGIRLDE